MTDLTQFALASSRDASAAAALPDIITVPKTNPRLPEGWSAHDASYRRDGSTVTLSFAHLTGPVAGKAILFSLPEGCRPSAWTVGSLVLVDQNGWPAGAAKVSVGPCWDTASAGNVEVILVDSTKAAEGQVVFQVDETPPPSSRLRGGERLVDFNFATTAGFSKLTRLRGWGSGLYGDPVNEALEDSCYAAPQVTMTPEGARLRVQPRPELGYLADGTMPYVAGYCSTADSLLLEGDWYAESEMYIPSEPGLSFAWWALARAPEGQDTPWPPEEDYVEVITDQVGRYRATANAHWSDGAGVHQQVGSRTYGPSPVGLHTWGIERRGATYGLYCDGWRRDSIVGAAPSYPMYMIWAMGVAKGATPVDASAYVRSLKVWRLV